MAPYELDNNEAARIVETMIALADLIEQPPGSPAYLDDHHLVSLTSPPAHVIYKDRPHMAANIRAAALAVYRQMPDDSPDRSGPYAFRATIKDLAG